MFGMNDNEWDGCLAEKKQHGEEKGGNNISHKKIGPGSDKVSGRKSSIQLPQCKLLFHPSSKQSIFYFPFTC